MAAADVIDPAGPRSGPAASRVFFGATVTYKDPGGREHVVRIVGTDEVDLNRGGGEASASGTIGVVKGEIPTCKRCTGELPGLR